MNELKNQVDTLLNEITAINDKAKAEKRSFIADEKTAIETKKTAIADLKSKIEVDSFVSEEHRESARKAFEKKEVAKREYSIGRAIKLAISGKPLDGVELEVEQEAEKFLKERGMQRQHPNSILIPASFVEKRATNNVSNQSSLVKTNLLDQISMVQYGPVIYDQVATVWNDVPNGNFAIPSLSNIIASYATTDSTATDLALTSAVKSLAPRWMQATGAFTKDFLASSTESMQAQVFGFFQYAVDRATDKQMFFDLTGATGAQIYLTGASRTYQSVLKLVNGIPYANAFVSSKRGQTFLQTTPTISGTSTNALPIWNAANQVAGLPAYSSFDSPLNLYAAGDFSNYHVVFWKNGVYELLVDPFTEARKGNIILQVSRMQNQGVGNPAGFSIAINGSIV